QKLRLEPGDRVVLRGRQKDGAFDLYVPPFAYESAGAQAGGGARGEVAARPPTTPGVGAPRRGRRGRLELPGPLGGADDRAGEHLKMPRPDVAWFELSYADGKPPEAALKTALRVDNRPGLVAPAWKIQLTNWDRNAGKDAIRRPVVTASWIEGFPGTA